MKDTTKKIIYIAIISILFICCGLLGMYIYKEKNNSNDIKKDLMVRSYYDKYEGKWYVSAAGFFTNECYSISQIERKDEKETKNVKVNVFITDNSKAGNCKNIDDDLYFVDNRGEINAPEDAHISINVIETTETKNSF